MSNTSLSFNHLHKPMSSAFAGSILTGLSGSSQSLSKTKDREREKTPTPFVEEDSYTDLTLIIEGKRLYTSRTLLSMCSPVFARMLSSSDDKDNESSGNRRELQLTGKSYDNILELLYILHPAYQRKVTDYNSFLVLPLAEEYQIWNLKQKCEETLLASLNSDKTVKEDLLIKCLNMANEFKLFALWTKCLQLCCKSSLPLQALQRCHEYENLNRFLKSMLEAFKGGNDVYKAEREPHRRDNNVLTTVISDRNIKKSGSHTQSTQTRY